MADWSLPTLTSLYTDVITYLRGRDEDAMTMQAGTNVPVGAIRLNRTTGQFEEWDGTNWNILPNVAWAGRRTDNYIWARKDSAIPLYATRGGNSDGTIAQFNWSANSGDDGVVRATILGTSTTSRLILYRPSDSNQRFFMDANDGLLSLNAYDYGASASLDFQIGGSDTQTITIPAVIDYTAKYIKLSNIQASISFDDQTAPDGYGLKRITCNDGDGNFNLRCLNYFSGAGIKYTNAGSGAAAIAMNAENVDGYIRLLAAPIASNAGDPVTWSTELTVNTNGVFIDKGLNINNSSSGNIVLNRQADTGSNGITWKTNSITNWILYEEGNTAGDLLLNAYDDTGAYTGNVFRVDRSTKKVNFKFGATLDGIPLMAPTGAVVAYASSTVPAGYLECNGAAISRTTYADLFNVIGTTFGAGDGSTTFNLPDLRGEFVRGFDNGRGVDSGRTFGSFQDEDFLRHGHTLTDQTWAKGNNGDSGDGNGSTSYYIADNTGSWITDATGGDETRPRNIALMYIIKY